MAEPLESREVIFEFVPVAAYMKVTAMDTETLIEITVQGPVNAGEASLKLLALKRLEYVLRKQGKIG